MPKKPSLQPLKEAIACNLSRLKHTKWRVVIGLIILLAVFGRIFLVSPPEQAHAATNTAIQYADTHWNCTTPSCSSTVAAGSLQTNFQCAEFVARALSTEGLIPGLNSNSPQSAYQYYRASNGVTYNLLWVGWTSASGYNTIKGLYQYLTETGRGSDIGNNPSQAAPGDVTIYHEGDGHTALLVQTGSNALVDAHNYSRYHVGYTEGYNLTIIHIKSSQP
jgi:hypothetical protein